MQETTTTPQTDLTLLVPFLPGAMARARQTLLDIGNDLDKRLPLRRSTSTHFARFVIIEGAHGKPDRLLFTSNYDGDEASYLAELLDTCKEGLDEIFQYCEGYPPKATTVLKKFSGFVQDYKESSQLFFVSLPGLTARSIKRAGKIRAILEEIADKHLYGLHQMLELSSITPDKGKRQSSSGLKKNSACMDKVLNFFAGIKTSGPSPNTIVQLHDLMKIEGPRTQNPLTIVAPVKRSIVRRVVLRLYLLLGRMLYLVSPPWGSLSGITSIHFARWVIVDGGDTIIFESNYDGSFDSYIDTFVDVTSAGLNVIWNSCEGYPSRGCQDIESFKQVISDHEVPASIFYSAYPELTVKNVIANHELDLAVQAFLRTPNTDRLLEGSYEIND